VCDQDGSNTAARGCSGGTKDTALGTSSFACIRLIQIGEKRCQVDIRHMVMHAADVMAAAADDA